MSKLRFAIATLAMIAVAGVGLLTFDNESEADLTPTATTLPTQSQLPTEPVPMVDCQYAGPVRCL